jgi:membrane-bound ClpP family serine protease
VGAIMLFRNAPSPYHVSTPLIISIAVVLGLLWGFALTKAVQIRRKPVSVGPQTIVGQIGEVRGAGQVFVNGELWRARPAGEVPLRRGTKVRVDGVDSSLVLDVSPAADEPIGSPQPV